MEKGDSNNTVLGFSVMMWNISRARNNSSNNSRQGLYYGDDEGESRPGIVPRIPYITFIYLILIFGILGNFGVFALMQHSCYRRKSYSVYLRFLVVSDSFLLLSVGLEDILDHQFNVLSQFLGSSLIICRLMDYCNHLSQFLSPWLIVALTVDRYLAVVFPLKRSFLCTLKISLKVSVSITVISLLESSLSQLQDFKLVGEGSFKDCESYYPEILEQYMTVRQLVLQSGLPCFILLILNVHVILTIKRSQKFNESCASTGNIRHRSTAISRVTMSLVAVSVMAFCTLVPITILEVLEYSWQREGFEEGSLEFNLLENASSTWPLLNLIFLINFGQNFYILILFGPQYRQALKSYFRCKRCKGRVNKSERNREIKETTTDIDRDTTNSVNTSLATVSCNLTLE